MPPSSSTASLADDETDDSDLVPGAQLARLGGRYRGPFYRLCFRAALGASLLVTLFPIYWLLVTALTPHYLVWGHVGVVPPEVSSEGFAMAFRRVDWVLAFANSLGIALLTTGLVLCVAVPAAYAFGRLEFPGRRPLFAAVLFLAVFPPQSIAIPLYELFVTPIPGLSKSAPTVYQTPAAVVLPISAFAMPLSLGLLTVFFAGIPDDLEDAARIAGATRVQALWRVVVPLARPGIVSVATLVFVAAYTEQFFTLFMTVGDGAVETTVQLEIYNIYNPFWALAYPNLLAAAGLIGLIPSFLVLLFVSGNLNGWLSAWGATTN
ncbi:carbohydrate ABC transporter permease [Haloarcula sp. JP-L23]|uniref:carbohydrate ABC transporter permease n=1 Tax=Haloarcula sp. JP-L23 TaxID=2716717 RepID=UPI00140EC84B|nr:carbohydrate ABC transporter permease [Haloarcula sp. JP-L23]